MAERLTYKAAGVDLDQYEETIGRILPLLRRTHTTRVLDRAGGFAGLFSLDYPERLFRRNYRRPVLVACADGVGTKLKVAMMAGRHDTIGIDLVAMCVNDCLCAGADPLFFLDYLAMGRDDPKLTEQIVSGIVRGCELADCALLGGETAVMPDFYKPDQYDLAGFCVGVVERYKIVDGSLIRPGDVIIGLSSSGLHSNGYSLVRKAVFDVAGLSIDAHVPELGRTVAEELLEPTRIYAKAVREVLRHYRVKRVVRGIAHITGGGLVDNLRRILPHTCRAVVERDRWPVPAVFPWVQALGRIDDAEMFRVFNMGVGMVLVCGAYYGERIRRQIESLGIAAWIIGQIESGEREVVLA